MTTAIDPGGSFAATRRTAWYDVAPASVSGAAWTGSSEASFTTSRVLRTRTYSASPPSAPYPRPTRPLGHVPSMPRAHHQQRPHELGETSATASPSASVGTPAPSACTHPAISWPSVNGIAQPRSSPADPGMCRIVMSEWHKPFPATFTTTSPAPGSGTAASVTSGGRSHSTRR